LLRGVLGALFAGHPGQEVVLFATPAGADLFPSPPPGVERVALPEAGYFTHLERQMARRGPHVLFRGYPADVPLAVPRPRQIVLVPDLRHEFLPESCSPEELARRGAAFVAAGEAGAVAAVSEYGRQAVQNFARPRQPDVFVMSPALEPRPPSSVADLSEEERANLPAGDFFLYPSVLAPHKNHRRLLAAFASFLRETPRRFELVLTGDPEGWPELAAAFPGLPVRHLGRARRPFLDVLLRRARALAFFSLYEGFPLPLLEAFHAGTPVACGNTTSLPEVGGDAVLSCDPTDTRAMCDLLRRLAGDEALRRALVARGKVRLARYSWHDSARNLLDACRRVAGRGPALTPLSRLGRAAARRVSRRVERYRQRVGGWLAPWLQPSLGVLHQHPPRPLRLPARYAREEPPRPAPLVSVVTPSYNQAAFLERTIRSVLGQNYPRLEYVVQDGGSADGSVAILEAFSGRLTRWESAPDAGQAQAINRGFRHTGGEILAYLNSDDVLLPGALAAVANFFSEHPDVDVVYGHRVIIDAEDREVGRWVLPPHDDGFLRWDDYVPQETLFWRRRIWERVGGLDESFHFALDWDLLLRFQEAGARFRRLSRFLGAFRLHPGQKTLTRITDLYWPEVRRLRERSHGGPVPYRHVLRARGPYLRRQGLYQRLHALGLLRC
jgi:glycosyltransferase involved in cell wall biosynthesis/GT2 family glycosyltransferase